MQFLKLREKQRIGFVGDGIRIYSERSDRKNRMVCPISRRRK